MSTPNEPQGEDRAAPDPGAAWVPEPSRAKPPAGRGREAPADAGRPIGRRVVLGMLGLGAVGIVAGRRIEDGLNDVLAPFERADPTGLTSLIPDEDHFEIYNVVGGYPDESDDEYRLAVTGLVDKPLNLTLDDLKAMPPRRLVKDFQCVTGWRVPNVHWEGVLLSHVLDLAGVQPAAKALRFSSFDGLYTESLTLSQARRSDVIVAYSMLGGPVSQAHGGPVRLYVAPMYGYKSCKWLKGIELTDKVDPGFWETNGNYSINAWIGDSNGRNDKPVD